MRYRPRWTLLGLGAIVVALLFTYPVWRKLMTGRASAEAFGEASDAQKEVFSKISKDKEIGREAAATIYVSMLTKVVPAPTSEQPTPVLPNAQIIRSGDFTEIDAVRTGKGSVKLYRSADGSLMLRLDDFSVTNGPDLAVYLSSAVAPKTRDELSSGGMPEFRVGPLKGNQGNQQYNIPKELKVANYRSVVIFSDALRVIYSSASLQ
jgi:hypothetical protein